MGALFGGLMSGTSLDGIDAVLLDLDDGGMIVAASHYVPYPDALRADLQQVAGGGAVPVSFLGALDVRLADAYADAALGLFAAAGVAPGDVAAVGCHGQTLWHAPHGPHPFTWQAGDPHRLAERLGTTVVADFRRRDVAAGGQGAPLVPAFHADVFRAVDENRVVLNLGGIGNVTWLPADGEVLGFDTGPANGLLDAWIQAQRGQAFDADGAWAASGHVDAVLLARLREEPWLATPPPRSTGRELFNLGWLEARAGARLGELAPKDVQATLAQYTAETVADALAFLPAWPERVITCGGGTHNLDLRRRLEAAFAARMAAAGMPDLAPRVESCAAHGLDPAHVEAAAFAWLAWRTLHGLPGNLPAVTGARGPRVLGCVVPG